MIDLGFIGKCISAVFGGNFREKANTNLEKGERSTIIAAAIVGLSGLGYKVVTGLRTVYKEKNNPEPEQRSNRSDSRRDRNLGRGNNRRKYN